MTNEKEVNPNARRPIQGPRIVEQSQASKEILEAFRKTASTASGQAVFKWFMEHCGYKHSSLTMTAEGVLLIDAVVHNEAMRNVWLAARKNISPELLNIIEREPTDADKPQEKE